MKHCCEDMAYYVLEVDDSCLKTSRAYQDSNKIVYYSAKFREYGIPVVTNTKKISGSYILMKYCPWCGKALPLSKREEWFDTLEKMGYDSPMEEKIPAEFETSAWYEKE